MICLKKLGRKNVEMSRNGGISIPAPYFFERWMVEMYRTRERERERGSFGGYGNTGSAGPCHTYDYYFLLLLS